MNTIIENILNLIYPETCGVCGRICQESLCKKCEIKLKEFELKNKRIKIIRNNDIFVDEIYSIYRYDGLIRALILKYKFNNKSYLYKTFSKIILNNKKICGFLKKYDIIIPVPIHKKRKSKRGYNQTELVACKLASKLNLKLERSVLIKVKNTRRQSELSREDRKINVLNAFKVSNINVTKEKNILILDDIYTTGSTVNECAKILKNSGAKKIGVLTIAKD